jgi:hypothetical protein
MHVTLVKPNFVKIMEEIYIIIGMIIFWIVATVGFVALVLFICRQGILLWAKLYGDVYNVWWLREYIHHRKPFKKYIEDKQKSFMED